MFGQYFISDKCVYSDHVCEVDYDIPIDENFDNSYPLNYYLCIILLSVLPLVFCTWCFTDILTKFWAYDWKTTRDWGSCMIFFMILYNLLIFIIPEKIETCAFPISCHEGINDTIVSTNYYYQMKECPKINSWLTDYYSDYYERQDCENSEWGCCEIDTDSIICSEFIDETYSYYEHVKNNYHGYWSIHINKIDEKGSNCPSIEKIIYEVSSNDKNDYVLLSILMTSLSILILIIINIFLICNRKEIYIQTDDIETQPFSPRNRILVGSA